MKTILTYTLLLFFSINSFAQYSYTSEVKAKNLVKQLPKKTLKIIFIFMHLMNLKEEILEQREKIKAIEYLVNFYKDAGIEAEIMEVTFKNETKYKKRKCWRG